MKRLAIFVLLVLLTSTMFGAQQLYIDQATLATDATFISRVKIAAVQYAINDVGVESDQVANHANRLSLADRVVKDPDSWARLLSVGVVGDLSFTASSTDAAIFSRVAFIWNTYALSK